MKFTNLFLFFLLTLFFLEPLVSIQSNVFELNFSSGKCPSVYFSSTTDWKIVKLVAWHIASFSFFFFSFLLLGTPVQRARQPPSCSLTLSERNASAVTQRFKLVLRLLTSMNTFVTSLQVTQVTAEKARTKLFLLLGLSIPWMPEEFYQTVSTVLTLS